MKRTLLLTTICLALGGCGTYSETSIKSLDFPVKTIALGEFKGNDQGIAQLFADKVAIQLTVAGFQIIADQNQADIIVTGSVSYIIPNSWQYGSSYWMLINKSGKGQILGTIECNVICQKESKEIASEMAKRLVKYLRKSDNR